MQQPWSVNRLQAFSAKGIGGRLSQSSAWVSATSREVSTELQSLSGENEAASAGGDWGQPHRLETEESWTLDYLKVLLVLVKTLLRSQSGPVCQTDRGLKILVQLPWKQTLVS